MSHLLQGDKLHCCVRDCKKLAGKCSSPQTLRASIRGLRSDFVMCFAKNACLTLMPSSLTIVVKACLRPVYFEARLVGWLPAVRLAIGSSCTWNLILITSKGPTANLAAHPAIAPAVASTTGLLFAFFTADIGILCAWHSQHSITGSATNICCSFGCGVARKNEPTQNRQMHQPHSCPD